jgi:glycosyltransferase involved in cell wall biosynthesis
MFLTRNSLDALSGGDKVQLLKTKEALEAIGQEVILGSGTSPDLHGIDLVHIFNPSLVPTQLIKKISRKKIPIAMSTIHWDMREYFSAMIRESFRFLKVRPNNFLVYFLSNEIRALIYRYVWNSHVEKTLHRAFSAGDILLPNSKAEADILTNDFQIPAKKIFPVVNGIDPRSSESSAFDFSKKYNVQNFILCVGRIEFRKNQAMLLRALLDTSHDIVFIGRPFNTGYTALCKKLAQQRPGKTLFIDHSSPAEVYAAYQAARVHALVSWYETPGLASLEAASCGTPIVVTDRGCTKEYFGTDAHYCEPTSEQSIRNAIEAAWSQEKNDALRTRITTTCSWHQTALQTVAAYRTILQS